MLYGGILLGFAALGGFAHARETVVVTLVQERLAGRAQIRSEAERMLKTLSAYPRLRGIEPMFTGAGRKMLDQLGQSGAAWSYVLHVEDANEAAELANWIQKKQETRAIPAVSVERRVP